jgi:hypothetical protein
MQKIKPFIFGILAALSALIAEFVLSDAYFISSGKEIGLNYSEKVTVFLFLVILIEEIAKYIMLLKIYTEQKSEKKKIYSALLLGLGFAIAESSFLYAHQNFAHFYLGMVSAIILHITTAGVIGQLLISRKNTSKVSTIKIIITAFGLHAVYNLMVIYNCSYSLIYSYLAIILILLTLLTQKFSPKYQA